MKKIVALFMLLTLACSVNSFGQTIPDEKLLMRTDALQTDKDGTLENVTIKIFCAPNFKGVPKIDLFFEDDPMAIFELVKFLNIGKCQVTRITVE